MKDRKELLGNMLAAREGAMMQTWQVSEEDGMDAALSVAIDELLKDCDELASNLPEFLRYKHGDFTLTEALNAFLSSRRAKLERVKTPEERVTAEFVDARDAFGHTVFVDGIERGFFASMADASIYRLGLIARLKAQLKESA